MSITGPITSRADFWRSLELQDDIELRKILKKVFDLRTKFNISTSVDIPAISGVDRNTDLILSLPDSRFPTCSNKR
jgi:hypothetical protein